MVDKDPLAVVQGPLQERVSGTEVTAGHSVSQRTGSEDTFCNEKAAIGCKREFAGTIDLSITAAVG